MKCQNPFFLHQGLNGQIDWYTYLTLPQDLRLMVMPFPCGRCKQCRILKAKYWTTRVILESTQHDCNSFITLTYDDELCPSDGGLLKSDLTKFFKRLRKRYESPLRYFAVGEYGHGKLLQPGQKKARKNNPHYHIILFNYPFYEKELISASWKFEGVPIGFITVGEVTPQSARYCTEYCVKKWDKNNARRPEHLPPEFMVSSRGRRKNNRESSKFSGGIGAPAIREIATNLRKQYQLKEDELYPGEPPVNIRYQGKKWPIDKYLRSKLYDYLKIDPKIKAQYLWNFQNKLFKEVEEGSEPIDLISTIKIKNEEISKKWSRKYEKRLKRRSI